MNEEIEKPMYQQIALDIARRIVEGEFSEGTKIHGRSTLAGEYNVSPETIRRALILLKDMGVVEIYHGSGVVIKSKKDAFRFVEKFKDIYSIAQLKNNLSSLIEERNNLERQMDNIINKIIDYSDRLRHVIPYNPIEIEIPKGSKLVGKSISEVKFWQETGGTIIGIRRGNKLILSPGPYAEFKEKDVLIIVGDELVFERVKNFI